MSSLVSVLIPAYNAERWIGQTIRSALQQTYARTELIIIDDGSKDKTLEIAQRFASESVKVVSRPHLGAPAARNAAYELAQGSYIQWLDADDLLAPGKIACQMKIVGDLSSRCLLSGQFGTFFYRHRRAAFARTSLWRDLTPIEYFLTRFTDNVWFQTGAWLVSRELCDAAGPWSDVGSPDDDGEYFCRVVAKSSGLKFVEEASAYYRVGNFGSVNNARSREALAALFLSKSKCIKYLLSLEDSPRTRAAALKFLQDLLHNFYPDRQEIIAQARELARGLGGDLKSPAIKWQYRPAEWTLGYALAMKLSRAIPRTKTVVAREWDRLLFELAPQIGPSLSPGFRNDLISG